MKNNVIMETLKAIPAVIGAWLANMTLNDWVAVLTAFYIAVQAAYLLRKWWREEKAIRARHERGAS